jgi:hypothetical protein
MSEYRSNRQSTGPEAPKAQESEQPQAMPRGSVGGDRAWAQNRIANFFKGQQAGRIQRKPADMGRAPSLGPAASGAGGDAHHQQTLADACTADPGIAKQKYQDVMHETQSRAVSVRPQFISGATERLQKGAPPLKAMRDEVADSGQKYLCLGIAIPEQAIAGANGVSRLVDLLSAHRFGYVSKAFLESHDIQTANQFVDRARDGRFVPERDMDDSAILRGRSEQTWWFASSAANAVDLDLLRKQLSIEEYPDYTKGVVRLDLPPTEIKTAGIEVFKPTSFDGMMQGTDADAMWKHSQHAHWGLTKNNTPEAVMKMMTLKHFKHRSLIMPTGPAAAAAHGGAGGASPSPNVAGHAAGNHTATGKHG